MCILYIYNIHIVDPNGMTLMFPNASSSFGGGARNPFAESCKVGREGPEGCQQLPDPCLNIICPCQLDTKKEVPCLSDQENTDLDDVWMLVTTLPAINTTMNLTYLVFVSCIP